MIVAARVAVPVGPFEMKLKGAGFLSRPNKFAPARVHSPIATTTTASPAINSGTLLALILPVQEGWSAERAPEDRSDGAASGGSPTVNTIAVLFSTMGPAPLAGSGSSVEGCADELGCE